MYTRSGFTSKLGQIRNWLVIIFEMNVEQDLRGKTILANFALERFVVYIVPCTFGVG